MNSYIIYLLKVCFGISLFVIPYFFFLKNDTNLNLKRFFLLSGVFFSFLIPALALKRPEIHIVNTPAFMIDPVIIRPVVIQATPDMAGNPAINWPTVILAIYLCGALVLLFRNVFLILKWNTVWNRAGNRSRDVAFSGNDEVFAIFSRIFLPAKLENTKEIDAILLHERAHIRQLHYIDLIIVELAMLITWFNPFTWLMSALVKENHEHLADREVLSGGMDPSHYRLQLLNQSLGVQVFGLAQQFNHSLTKKRFEMMKKSKSIKTGMGKIIILVPVVLIILAFVTGTNGQDPESKNTQLKPINGKVTLLDTGKPAKGAFVLVKNVNKGMFVDSKGEFRFGYGIKVKDIEITISYTGYETQKLIVNQGNSYEIRLEPIKTEKELSSQKETIKSPTLVILDGKKLNVKIEEVNQDLIEKDITVVSPGVASNYYGESGKNGALVLNTKNKVLNTKNKTSEAEEPAFYIVEEMPKFNGGDPGIEFKKYIIENLVYPPEAVKDSLSGRVITQFIVSSEGIVKDVKIKMSSSEVFNESAIKTIQSSPAWTPGKLRGRAVPVFFTFPVTYALK